MRVPRHKDRGILSFICFGVSPWICLRVLSLPPRRKPTVISAIAPRGACGFVQFVLIAGLRSNRLPTTAATRPTVGSVGESG